MSDGGLGQPKAGLPARRCLMQHSTDWAVYRLGREHTTLPRVFRNETAGR